MVAQAVSWIPLGALALRYEGVLLAVAPLVLVSYLVLWLTLRAGRRVADWVTAARLVMVVAVFLAILTAGRIEAWAWICFCVAALADLIDGWVARRFGGSAAGAVLDMEADQAALVVFALAALHFDAVTGFVLLLPAFRYAYVVSMKLRGVAVHDPKPLDGDNRRAKIICATVVVLLLAMLCPYIDVWLGRALAARLDSWLVSLAIALLAFSYSSDVVQLFARREHAG